MGATARFSTWEPPTSFDSFEIERALGVGGMGHVYLGRDVMLDRPVALKFIADSSPTSQARERFIIEARAIAKLVHPNVVSVFRIGEVDGRPYIAYELVDGNSLDTLARPLTWSVVLRITTLLVRGLEAAHRAGIVHRDVKPSNVMLSSTGEVKLLDFGIAKLAEPNPSLPPSAPPTTRPEKEDDAAFAPTASAPLSLPDPARSAGLTRPGALIGTPAYLAPEVWAGASASTRSDVYAVGLVMYELVTGALPFAPLGGIELARAVLERDAPPVRSRRPDIPPALATIIDTCLRRDPRLRYETAGDLRAELEKVKSVYIPRETELGEIRLNHEARIVLDSFARMLSRERDLVSGVYSRLFAADPTARELFPEDLTAQKAKLAHALKLAIEGLQEPDRIVDMLRELGRRHGGYGVTPAHFESLGQALHATVRELDQASWNDELSTACRQAYAFIATAMKQGLSGVGTTAISQIADTPASSLQSPKASSGTSAPMSPRQLAVPRTQYARNGDVSIAYHVLGEGPDLVVVLGWVTHLELSYAHGLLRDFLFSLASRHRVIVFDKRGTGLSDRVKAETIEDRTGDIEAVMDAAASERAAFLGVSDGAALAVHLAVRSPARVRGLVGWGTSARLLNGHDYDAGVAPELMDRMYATLQERWGEPVLVDVLAPSMVKDREFGEWLASYTRSAASPGNAVALLKEIASADLRATLPQVRVPTLVMHRHGDRFAPLEGGRRFADLVPGAFWRELEGDDHLPYVGNAWGVLDTLFDFIAALPKGRSAA